MLCKATGRVWLIITLLLHYYLNEIWQSLLFTRDVCIIKSTRKCIDQITRNWKVSITLFFWWIVWTNTSIHIEHGRSNWTIQGNGTLTVIERERAVHKLLDQPQHLSECCCWPCSSVSYWLQPAAWCSGRLHCLFLEHHRELGELHGPPVIRCESSWTSWRCGTERYIGSMNVHLTNLQRWCGAVVSTWSREFTSFVD